jgi:sugar phosphate isomerase/epimerase
MNFNLDWFSRWGELARKHNVGIAVENMIASKKAGRFALSSEDLVELIDTLKDENIGICWDFGHANLRDIDQVAALRNIGKRLKATHVDDNFGETDQHLAPYFGTIKWEPIMHALAEIGYEGDFTFEIHNFTGFVPAFVHQSLVKFTYDLGQHMLSIVNRETGSAVESSL